MFKNPSLESKQIYQIELILLTLVSIGCIALNAVRASKLIAPTQAATASNVREQQLQNAIKVLTPTTSSN